MSVLTEACLASVAAPFYSELIFSSYPAQVFCIFNQGKNNNVFGYFSSKKEIWCTQFPFWYQFETFHRGYVDPISSRWKARYGIQVAHAKRLLTLLIFLFFFAQKEIWCTQFQFGYQFETFHRGYVDPICPRWRARYGIQVAHAKRLLTLLPDGFQHPCGPIGQKRTILWAIRQANDVL